MKHRLLALGEIRMHYQVLVQRHSNTQFMASVLGIPNTTVEGKTREDAILNAKRALQHHLETGELVTIQLETEPNLQETDPRITPRGIFADDPIFDDWMEKMALIRQEANAVDADE